LFLTSRTPNAQTRPKPRGLRVRVCARLTSGLRASVTRHRLRVTWAQVGLIALVGLTTWAVASVSLWWIPAYLALMVLIFVTPRGQHPRVASPTQCTESVGAGIAGLGKDLRVDRVDGLAQHHPVSELQADPPADVPSEPTSFAADPVGDVAPKPRKSRARVRKLVKPAAALIPDSPPVTWIQVGPGKFVRLEGRGQVTDPTETTLATVGANPDADAPLHVAAAATAPAETLAEQDPSTPPETSPGEVGLVLASDDCPGGSNTEEYGIAPSAFSVSSEVSHSVDSQDHVPGAVTEPESDPGPLVSQGERLSWRVMGSGRLWSQQGTSRRRSRRVIRGMAPAIPALGRASRRCNLCISPDTRSTVGFRFAPNVRRQQAACRAFGRMTHVHRALRPRSPPLSSRSA
jgi:hypothetical protein